MVAVSNGLDRIAARTDSWDKKPLWASCHVYSICRNVREHVVPDSLPERLMWYVTTGRWRSSCTSSGSSASRAAAMSRMRCNVASHSRSTEARSSRLMQPPLKAFSACSLQRHAGQLSRYAPMMRSQCTMFERHLMHHITCATTETAHDDVRRAMETSHLCLG